MSKCQPVSADDKKWEAENDGRTLIRSQEIRNDKARYKRALADLTKRQKAAEDAVALEAKVGHKLKTTFGREKK